MIFLPGMQWGCIGSLDMLGYEEMRSPMSSQEMAMLLKFVGPELASGVFREDIRIRWLVNQHWVWWRGLGHTHRQAQELISGPCLGAKARVLSFNRTQSRAVTGLLTGHNTLRRHLHLTGLCQTVHCVGGVEQRMKPHSL